MTSRLVASERPTISARPGDLGGTASPITSSTGPKLSLLWLYAILNMLFRDVHELTTASAVNEILSGYLNGVPVSEGLLVAGALIIQLPLLAMLFSSLLGPRPARLVNLVVAPVAVLGTLAARPSDPDDYLFAAIEIATFAVIFVIAWRWKTQEPAPVSK